MSADLKASLTKGVWPQISPDPRMPRADAMRAIMGKLPFDAATALSRSSFDSVLGSMMPTIRSRCVCSMRMSSANHAVVQMIGVVLGVPSIYAA